MNAYKYDRPLPEAPPPALISQPDGKRDGENIFGLTPRERDKDPSHDGVFWPGRHDQEGPSVVVAACFWASFKPSNMEE
jgi:hypothetical protein